MKNEEILKTPSLGEFWVMNAKGELLLRDLQKEGKTFTFEKYCNGEFDAYNYVWFENFECYEHETDGCDYERLGCQIQEGDVVLDVGGNIGAFARRAEVRGASRVLSFEPVSPTYECLKRNAGPKTETYKMGIAGKTCFPEFEIHTDYTKLGGGSMAVKYPGDIVFKEKALCLGVNDLFESGLFEKIDFMKVDIEGGEFELFRTIKDEHLAKMRCVAIEVHNCFPDTDEFQRDLIERMNKLGFTSFTLWYSQNFLRTVTLWKV
jgi:FkbM family methyltransferase